MWNGSGKVSILALILISEEKLSYLPICNMLAGVNEGMEPKQKQYPVVDVTGDRSNVRCRKEQYCIGTWNVRSMNQGELEVVKQEMARVNVDILGISELKMDWNG